MAGHHGNFLWYELLTSDADAAQAFYGKLLGWTATSSDPGDVDYRFLSAGDSGIAGVLPLTPEMTGNGARPCWLGYIGVDDADAAIAAIGQAGGSVHRPAWDIPDVGRIALVADPQGVMFYVMAAVPSASGSTAFAATEPMVGHCAWNELVSTDPDAAVSFYTSQFGWLQKDEMDMGPIGPYKFFHHGEYMIGAVMAKPEQMPVPAWVYYFRVADIDAAVRTITSNGGQVVMDPIEIPGGDFALQAIDPQGASFALVGARTG